MVSLLQVVAGGGAYLVEHQHSQTLTLTGNFQPIVSANQWALWSKADMASGRRLARGVTLQWALPSNQHKNDIRIKKRIYKDSGLELNTAAQNIQVQLQAPLSGGAGGAGGANEKRSSSRDRRKRRRRTAGREDRFVGTAEKGAGRSAGEGRGV